MQQIAADFSDFLPICLVVLIDKCNFATKSRWKKCSEVPRTGISYIAIKFPLRFLVRFKTLHPICIHLRKK